MAEHGYARDYDEPIDRGNDDRDRWRDDDRERRSRGSGDDWRSREHGWRNEERDPNERNRNFMLGDQDRSWERDSQRGDEDRSAFGGARSWFRDDDRQYRGTHQDDWNRQDRGRSGREQGFSGFGPSADRSGGQASRKFGGGQHDHYISWRNRQMEALDRDYEDYCREREQQFHSDFDSWRQNRQNRGAQQQQGQQGSSSEEVMELNNPTKLSTEPHSVSNPTADATLGTNNTENTGPGRAGG